VAGTGAYGYSGDNGPAIGAQLAMPFGVAVDASGNLYIADAGRLRKVDSSGIITSVAGNITLVATDATNLIIDINGYFAPPGSPGGMQFHTATPCRIIDTRGTAGPFGGPPLTASIERVFVVAASACGIPANAGAYSLNATVIPPAPLGFLSLWGPGGQPSVSTLNASDGSIVANAALVPASADGWVCALASHNTNLILDINGHFRSVGRLRRQTPSDVRVATGKR
jgi:hypothetical protein